MAFVNYPMSYTEIYGIFTVFTDHPIPQICNIIFGPVIKFLLDGKGGKTELVPILFLKFA